MPTCDKCTQHFPNWIIVEGKHRNLCSRRFCLNCSPFGSHNTKDIRTEGTTRNTAPDKRVPTCLRCKIEINALNSYKKSGKNYLLSYCRDCFNYNAHERQKKTKRLCVEYKGGCCAVCGYDLYIQALEFHHLESDLKEIEISRSRGRAFGNLKAELDKCILLCCRCHREVHAGAVQLQNIVPAA